MVHEILINQRDFILQLQALCLPYIEMRCLYFHLHKIQDCLKMHIKKSKKKNFKLPKNDYFKFRNEKKIIKFDNIIFGSL